MARTYWRAVTSSNMADGLYNCNRWYPYHNKSIANQNTLEKANGTGTANTGNKGYTILLLLLDYIYTPSGPQRKARAKPSNHLEKKYLATARIGDIYKKRARVRKWW